MLAPQQGHLRDARAARGRSARRVPRRSSRAARATSTTSTTTTSEFYIRTNDKGRNFRLVTAPVADPRATQLAPGGGAPPAGDARGGRPLPGLLGAGGARQGPAAPSRHRLRDRQGALHRLRRGGLLGALERQRGVRHAARSASSTRAWSRRARGTTTTSPRAQRTLLKQQPVLGGYDPARLRVEGAHRASRRTARACRSRSSTASRCAATARSRCCSTAMAPTASRWTRASRSARISLLDRGMIYAIAHVRGGGDRGQHLVRRGQAARRRRTPSPTSSPCAESLVRRQVHRARSAGDPGRQRRGPADGRGRPTCAPTSSRRSWRRCRSST